MPSKLCTAEGSLQMEARSLEQIFLSSGYVHMLSDHRGAQMRALSQSMELHCLAGRYAVTRKLSFLLYFPVYFAYA